MLSFIKKIVLRDIVQPYIRKTPLYPLRHRLNAIVASRVYDDPAKDMVIIGVTGTDGKTSTCNMIHHIIESSLGGCVMVSTANIKIGPKVLRNTAKMTSLNLFALQKVLAQAKVQGCKYAVIEVSSHGLDQGRFGNIAFSIGVLTNITPEHLDYHETLDQYAQTKKKLFEIIQKSTNTNIKKTAILPRDDEYGRKRISELQLDQIIDYSLSANSVIKADNIQLSKNDTQADISYLGQSYHISTQLLGKFNISNWLAAIGVGVTLGIDISQIIQHISTLEPIDGRARCISYDGISYFVDFAHTPNGLANILSYLSSVKGDARIITVFGAPGLRDIYKRPQMCQIVSQYSDIYIITEDDSVSEDTYKILSDVSAGIADDDILGQDYHIVPDRRYAIDLAISLARHGDIVLLAGKGHETQLYTNFATIAHNDMAYLQDKLGTK